MRHFLSSIIYRSVIVFLIYLLLGGVGAAQNARLTRQSRQQPAPLNQADQPKRINRPTSNPYKGKLSIFEDPKRAERLQIDRVMDMLGIKEGKGVADIGAGGGWFTVRAAARVGSSGIVYAVEINPDFLEYIRKRAAAEGLSNIRTVPGKEDDPMLSPQSVDAVLMLKAYHEIAQPILLLSHLQNAMRPGALLGIIDKNGKGDDHGIDSRTVIKEVEQAGFSLIEQYDFVKPDGMDYFLVFKRRAGSG
ncbi:MAG: class I SAM-dependent methyltransferase [Blastocatellia bacterium]